ncbi:unnamed protein product [Lampetra fluviatilis]
MAALHRCRRRPLPPARGAAAMGLLLAVVMWPQPAAGDCWLVVDARTGVHRKAICSENRPPFTAVPRHLNVSLTELQLSGNQISTPDRSSLSRYSSLLTLDLSRNSIATLPAASFRPLAHLAHLDLAHNPLRLVHRDSLLGLVSLRRVEPPRRAALLAAGGPPATLAGPPRPRPGPQPARGADRPTPSRGPGASGGCPWPATRSTAAALASCRRSSGSSGRLAPPGSRRRFHRLRLRRPPAWR